MIEFNIEKTMSFSGHRNIQLSDNLYQNLNNLILQYVKDGYDTFLLGMAKGFDLICGLCILKLREVYTHIKIIPVVPCDNQTESFSVSEMISYKKIMESAYEIIQTGKSQTAYSMRKRNRFLVDNSSILICFLTYNKSGTYYTCNYAYKKGVQVINIADISE
ncbi:MAG: SLOG family protein [Bacillota bacterium]